MSNSKQVAVKDANPLPAFLKRYEGVTGSESIETEDITLPRVKIGQDMSKEVQEGGVERGDLFLNITGQSLVKAGKPLTVVVVARGKEYILWRPRKDNGGGILDRARPVQTEDGIRYAWDNPNQTYDVKVDGKIKAKWSTKNYIDEDGLDEWGSEIPGDKESGIAATAHHSYVVVLPEHGSTIAALSLSKSQAKKAKDFNALLKMIPNVPIWGRKFTVTTIDEHNDNGDFKNVSIKPAGFVSEEEFEQYTKLAETFRDKAYTVDQSDEDSGEATDGKL